MWRTRESLFRSSSLLRQSLRLLSSNSSSAAVASCTHQTVSDGSSPSPAQETPNLTSGFQKPTEKYKGSVDNAETAKFAAIADTWWDHNGPYKPLHSINPVRLSFIRSALCQHFRKDASTAKPLDGLTVVDVGCGGGLVCEDSCVSLSNVIAGIEDAQEYLTSLQRSMFLSTKLIYLPLARMGAQILGVDAVEKNIRVASVHSTKDPSTSSIQYRCTTAEQLVEEKQAFDVVLALEVIEHVADPMEFCKSLAALAKNDGMVIISTLNRSIAAYGLAIVGAEYILGWLPRGTHDWSKFITPEELVLLTNRASLSIEEMAGIVFNPFTQKWSMSEDTSVNYMASSVKRET